MKTPATRRPITLLHLALVATLALSLNACSDENLAGPSADPGPEASEPAMYQVVIDMSHFDIIKDCDKNDIVQDPNPGEFDYTIAIWAQNWEATKYEKVKEITGSFIRNGGSSFTLNRTEEFRVRAGNKYYVGVKATERDPAGNPDDYVGYAQDVNRTGGQAYYDHVLSIGSGGCHLKFHYTAEEIPID